MTWEGRSSQQWGEKLDELYPIRRDDNEESKGMWIEGKFAVCTPREKLFVLVLISVYFWFFCLHTKEESIYYFLKFRDTLLHLEWLWQFELIVFMADKLKSSKSAVSASTNRSRWKTIVDSIAKQVSQVCTTHFPVIFGPYLLCTCAFIA